MADKLVSLPATQKYVRNRDIWDLAWLKQQGATVQFDLVTQKIQDYKIVGFPSMLASMITHLPDIISGEEFLAEMKRFTPTNVYDRTLGQEKFVRYLTNTLVALLKELAPTISDDALTTEFSM